MDKERFYNKAYPDGSITTVCLLLHNQVIKARGIALMAPDDLYSREKGELMASLRAYKALVSKKDLFPILKNGNMNIAKREEGLFKATYKPEPDKWEQALLIPGGEGRLLLVT